MKRIGILILFFSVAYVLLPANIQADNSGVNDDHKVIICHIPPGNPENAHIIEVGRPALEAHLAHGDRAGECDPPAGGDDDDDNGDGGDDGDNDDGGDNENVSPIWSGPTVATTTVGQLVEATISATDQDNDELKITYELPGGATYTATTSIFSWTPTQTGTTTAKFFAFDGQTTSTHELVIEVFAAQVGGEDDDEPPADEDDNDNDPDPDDGNSDNNNNGNDSNSGSNNSSGSNGSGGNSGNSSGNSGSGGGGGGGSGGTGGVYPGVLTAPQVDYGNSGGGQVAGASSQNLPPYFVNFNPGVSATSSWLYIYDAEALDPENDKLIYSLVEKPDGMSIVSITGFIYWMPDEGQVREKPYIVTVEVSDGINSARETFQIKVNKNLNDPVTNSALLKPDILIIEGTVTFTPPRVKGTDSSFDISILNRNSDAEVPDSAGRWNFAALLFSGLFNTLEKLMNWILNNCCWFLLILFIILLIVFAWYIVRTRKREARAKRINEELRKRLLESMERNRESGVWPNA